VHRGDEGIPSDEIQLQGDDSAQQVAVDGW